MTRRSSQSQRAPKVDDTSSPRFTVEEDGEYFYIQDNSTHQRLPYQSRDRTFVDGVAQRLMSDYEQYVDSQLRPDHPQNPKSKI